MSLIKEAASGAKWTTASQVGTTVLKLVELGVLARLLDATDFGLMAMVVVVIGFASTYIDMGIGNAIVHRQDSTDEQLSSLYWLNLAAGSIVFVIVLLVIPLVVDFYNEPRLSNLLLWASLTFVISPFGQQFNFLMQKNLQFKLRSYISLIGALFGTIVAVTAAFMGQGVYSLIWGLLTKTAASTLGYMYFGYRQWPPAFHFSWSDLEGYLSFGMYQLGDKTLSYFTKNIDYILIGRYLGPEILGAYTIAFQLVIVPIQKINPILTKVAFPLFAKKQHENATLRYGYLQMSKILAGAVYPLLIGLAAIAPLAIPVFLGEGWELSIILTQLLVVVGLARTLGNPSGTIYLAKGRADISFKFNLGTAIISALVFWYFVQFGAVAIAGSFSILNTFYFLVNLYILSSLIELRWKKYFMAVYKQIFLSLFMGGMVYALYMSLDDTIDAKLLLVLLILAGAGIYLLFTFLIEKKFVYELYSLLIGDKKSPNKMKTASEA